MTSIMDKRAAVDDGLGPLLAARLKREREGRGWSIGDLAGESGVSRAMISKIERAQASPTAALLGRLSGAFGLTVSALLARAEADGAGAGGRVARAADQVVWTDPETGYLRRSLSPPGADPELVHIDLPPGATVPYPASAYAFLRGQCIWVLAGRLTIREDGEETLLHSGDCLALDLASARDRAFVNPSASQPARYVVSLARR